MKNSSKFFVFLAVACQLITLSSCHLTLYAVEFEVLDKLKVDGGIEVSTSATAAPVISVSSTTNQGNVGIGTTAPGAKLHVLDGDIKISTTGTSRGIIFQDGTTQLTAAAGGGGNWTLVANMTGSFNNPPTFSGLSLSTHRAYLLTYTMSIQSGSPGYVALQTNGGSPANTAAQYQLNYSAGVTLTAEGATNLSNARICRTNRGSDIAEVVGWVYIWFPVNSGFPHFQAQCTASDQSSVQNLELSHVGGRLYLGSGNDLTSLKAISDGLTNIFNSSQFSLYEAQ